MMLCVTMTSNHPAVELAQILKPGNPGNQKKKKEREREKCQHHLKDVSNSQITMELSI